MATLPRVRLNSAYGGGKMPAVKPMKEQGASGTPIYAGFIQRKDKAAQWTRGRRYDISSEIVVNVSIVAASVRYFLNLISHPEWSVVPSDKDDKEAVELAEFVEDVIHDMVTPWNRTVRRAGTYLFHGFGIQEWTAKKREDGAIGLLDIEPRPQHTIERWEVDDSGTVLGVWQRNPQNNALLGLPRGKTVYLVEDMLTDSPEGLGIFRSLLEPYNRLKQYLELETRAFERDLRGTPIGRAPLGKLREMVSLGEITKEQAEELIQGMKNFVELQVKGSDTGALLDSQPYESTAADGPKVSPQLQWDLELLTGSANGLTELAHAIDRIQREMARIVGTESLMMGDSGGNRALSEDKSRNLYLNANSVLTSIVQANTKDIIDPIWNLNSLPEDKKPSFSAEDVAFKDVDQVTRALADMAQAGAMLTPDDPAVNDVRDLLGIQRFDPAESLFGFPGLEPEADTGAPGRAAEMDEGESMPDATQRTPASARKVKKSRGRVRNRL